MTSPSLGEPTPGEPSPGEPSPGEPTKGEATRALIVETALRLFADQGYDKTTMRAIADAAGVSVGNAYYYFASKEHLIQGFYDRLADDHRRACQPLLAGTDDFGERLAGVLNTWLDLAQPLQPFAVQFFKNAADPASPLSPFSAESAPARTTSIEMMAQVIDGSSISMDPTLRTDLPELLWLAEMGMVLFWVYDSSPDATRTRTLVRRSVPLIERLIGLSRLRVLRPTTREVTSLLSDLGMKFAARK